MLPSVDQTISLANWQRKDDSKAHFLSKPIGFLRAKCETGRFHIPGPGNCKIKVLSTSDQDHVTAKVRFVKLSCGTNPDQHLLTPREPGGQCLLLCYQFRGNRYDTARQPQFGSSKKYVEPELRLIVGSAVLDLPSLMFTVRRDTVWLSLAIYAYSLAFHGRTS